MTKRVIQTATLPMIPLRGLVVFPGMLLHFDIGRTKSALALHDCMDVDQTVFLLSQRVLEADDPTIEDLYETGVVAKVRQVLKSSNDTLRVLVEGLYRAKISEVVQAEPFFMVSVRERPEPSNLEPLEEEALLRECRARFAEYADIAEEDIAPDVMMGVSTARKVGYLADYIAANLPMPIEEKALVLHTLPIARRVERLMSILSRECEVLKLEKDIHARVQERMDQSQKEYYLREQMRVIAEELGDGDNPLEEAQEYEQQIRELHLDAEAEKVLLKEVALRASENTSSWEKNPSTSSRGS